MMFPFAPSPGTFTGMRPTAQQPTLPLAMTIAPALRVLYHDPADAHSSGSSGTHPSRESALAAHVSAGRHGCLRRTRRRRGRKRLRHCWNSRWMELSGPGPVQFDGTYQIGALAVNRTYKSMPSRSRRRRPLRSFNALVSLCRNSTTTPAGPRSSPA